MSSTHLDLPEQQKSETARTLEVSEEHLPALARFFHAVWGSRSTAEEVAAARRDQAAANPVTPGAVPPAFAFLLGDEVVGYVGTIPARLWNGAGEVAAAWIKGLMVVPEQRSGPVGYLVLKEATRRVGIAAGFVVAQPAVRLFSALGYRNLGALSNDILPLAPSRIAARLDVQAVASRAPAIVRTAAGVAQRAGIAALAGHLLSVPLRARSLYLRLRSRGYETVIGEERIVDAELDGLWSRVRTSIRAAAVRDARYLRWRYGGIGSHYRLIGVRKDGNLEAVGVLKVPGASDSDPRLRGLRIATLSDLVFPIDRPEVARALLSVVELEGRRLGADAILCSVSHPTARAALRKQGYLPVSGTVCFLLKSGDEEGLPTDLSEWWLTRGDGASDEGIS